MSGGLGASLSDETINRGPVCYTQFSAHVKEPTATWELSLAKFLEKSHSDRETNTVADQKKKKRKKRGGAALVATRSPRGEQPEFHAEKSRDLKWYKIKIK